LSFLETSMSTDMKALLYAQADTMEAQARALRALADAYNDAGAADPLLDCEQIRKAYAMGAEAVRAAVTRGELTAVRAGRGKIMVRASELQRYLQSRPYQPTQRRPLKTEKPANDFDAAQEAELARLEAGR
jgi:hypothetical protein